MGADSKDQTSFTSKYAVTLKPMPDEYTQQHAKIKWWDHLIVRIANVPGLTQVAHNLTPAPVSAIVDVSLADAPLLPTTDPSLSGRQGRFLTSGRSSELGLGVCVQAP